MLGVSWQNVNRWWTLYEEGGFEAPKLGPRGPVVVITDNLSVHHGKRVAQSVSEQDGNLVLEFIPSYSRNSTPTSNSTAT